MSRVLACPILCLALAAAPLHAQTSAIPSATGDVLVRVDVTDVAEPLAVELGIGKDELPRSVEVPTDIAAIVCELDIEQLEHVRAIEQHVECKAAQVSAELAAATEEQLER